MAINTNPSNPEEVSSAPEQNDVVAEPNGAVKLPLQRRIENALNGDEFSQQLERYGFSSAAEVAGFRRFSDMHKVAQTKASGRADATPPTYQFYREAKRRAMQAENVMRDAIASQDPVSQSLRHVRPPSLPESVTRALQEEPIRYAKPESIQSSQSPAAYLKHIYDLATTKITPAIEAFGLNVRRPDLQNLELSEDNLHQQITTLELVNEVLLAQLNSENGLDFSGTGSKIDINSIKFRFDPLIWTLELWIRVNELSPEIEYHTVVSSDSNPDSNSQQSPFIMVLKPREGSSSYNLQVGFGDGSGTPTSNIWREVLTLKEWHHIAAVCDGKHIYLIKNGEVFGDPHVISLFDPAVTREPTVIGNFSDDTPFPGGQIRDVRLWKVARSPEKIVADMNRRLNGDEEGLVAYFPMDEGSGTEIKNLADPTGNSNGILAGPSLPSWINPISSLFESFKTQLHPLALPFDRNIATIRTGLAQMNNMSLNEITRRIRYDYAFKAGNFTLVPSPVDALNLLQSEFEVLKTITSNEIDKFKKIFGDSIEEISQLKIVNVFTAATDISFDEFCQLYRDGKSISDEAGNVYESCVYGATFFTKYYLRLSLNKEQQLEMHSVGSTSNRTEFIADTFFAMNHLVRLYKRTGLAFHELDWLLSAVPGASSGKTVTDLGFDVIAHYLYWRKHYNLSVDQFAGLLGQVNGYRRLGEQDTTLMRQLFGENAALVTTTVLAKNTTLSDVDTKTENGISLGDILRRGLKLSQVEWTVIVNLVDSKSTLNSKNLVRLYRMATLFPLLGWDVLSGIELVNKIDSAMLDNLKMLDTLKSEPSATNTKPLLSVMDRLAWLSQWMKTAGFSVAEVLMVLTPPDQAVLQATQAVTNWLHELHQAIQQHRFNESGLPRYKEPTNDSPIPTWLDKLKDQEILNTYGLVKKDVNQETISNAVKKILAERDTENDEVLKNSLIEQLVQIQTSQQQALANQVVQLTDNGNPEIIPPLLGWMGTDAYTVLNTLLSWDYPGSSRNSQLSDGNSVGNVLSLREVDNSHLQEIYNLARHLTVISKLSLDAATVAMLADNPVWLAPNMDSPLSLEQVYYLERFKQLQNAEVSADLWLSFFKKVTENPENATQNEAILAQLLDWKKEEITSLGVDAFPKNVQEVSAIARKIQLCRELSLSATELANITSNDTNKAAGAVLSALYRYQDGAQATAAKNALNEQIRDVLVAAYLSQVVAKDETLKNLIKDEETLYEYLLLDVNVSSAVPTSRLVEANSSVQLYINRMLEGVEDATFGDNNNEKAALNDEWETAQQYRVWEANEKLKLYPSNYIEPELRFTKTELFKQFEQSLAQGYLNEDIIETALYSYMRELQHLAELQPKGFFHIRGVNHIDYYFTAQASWSHLTYYYRHMRLDLDLLKDGNRQACQWGEWKRVDLPAVNQTVYGIYPAFAWNRLFLLWYELEEQRSEDGEQKRYFLRPKYMRQGVDGSFDEAWDPDLGEGVDLEVTDVTERQPTVYQAYYNAGTIDQLFVVNNQNYRFQITQKTADVNIDNDTNLPTAPDLNGYDSTQSFFIGDTAKLSFEPSRLTMNGEFSGDYLRVAINKNSGFPVVLKVESVANEPARLQLSNNSAMDILVKGQAGAWGYDYPQEFSLEVYIDGNLKKSKPLILLSDNPWAHGALVQDWNQEIDLINTSEGNIEVKFNYKCKVVVENVENRQPGEVKFGPSEQVEYRLTETATDLLFYEESGFRKKEAYLVCNGATDKDSRHIIHLVSPAMRNVPELLPIPSDITTLFSTLHQQYAEEGVDTFLNLAQADKNIGTIADPKPKNTFDFDGPFGLYGWEVFFHIPALIASKYADNGDYDAAKRWMKCIYNPSAEGNVWGVLPLISDSNNGTRSITDPDNVALKNPIHYQNAIIRQHLEHLLAEGDDYYRQQTQETLQQAKLRYVVAKNLFSTELSKELEVLTVSDWSNPTLGDVTAENFRSPYNQEIKKLYHTFEQRLHNLRHWLTIDGEPLNIPLLAPPIDPRQLQVAALAGVAATQAQFLSQMTLLYTFDEILAKAQNYTKELMNFANSLQAGLEKRDERALEELTQSQQQKLLEFVHSTQQQQIKIVETAKEALEKAQATLQTEYEGQSRLADEYMNDPETASLTLLPARTELLITSSAAATGAGFAGLIPTIFGMANGGSKGEEPLIGAQELARNSADTIRDLMDVAKDAGAYQRRQETEQLRRDVLKGELKEIEVRIKEAQLIINQEQSKLREIERQQEHTAQLVDFMQRRFTNQQFYEWYVSKLSNLYSAAYDATVRFALMAERAFQSETDDRTATFIRPQWDRRYKGLLAGQALWVDLERMDLAYMSRREPAQQSTKVISLRELDASALGSLKANGETVFFLKESLFEADYPDHYRRRIQSIRVSFPALKDKGINPCGQLTQLSSRSYHSRQRDAKNSSADLFANQSIILGGWETDSRELKMPRGRLLPFQGTGVDSTWHLSLPAAAKAVRKKLSSFPQKAVLDELDDVVIEITYSAQV
jgi:hypothetical protein